MRLSLPKFCIFTIALALGVMFGARVDNATAATASHVVISEVQVAGNGVNGFSDEFVELYNPTSLDVNLNNWKLAKKTSLGTETILIATVSGIIKSHGYFLFTAQPGYTGAIAGDQTYATASGSFSSGNTVLLYDASGTNVVDKLGFTGAADFETDAEPIPGAGKSRERSANSTSTKAKMAIGGSQEFLGNGEDTDNNDADFNERDLPQPQNSTSAIEPIATSTPTATLTPTSTPSLTPTITVAPTLSPTTAVSPTLAVSPSPSSTPTATLTPSPIPNFHLACTTKTLTFRILNLTIHIPLVSCSLVK